MKPTLWNHLASFSSFSLYHVFFLLPVALLTMVNLDFQLCHLPGDPTYGFIGHHYYGFHVLTMTTLSFMTRWLMDKVIIRLEVDLKRYGLA